MGDAADDAYDAGMRHADIAWEMEKAGCVPCPRLRKHDENECPICLDFGWIDEDGNPVEP